VFSLALGFVRAGTKTSVLPGGANNWTQTDLKSNLIAD